jgi:integrase
MGTVRQLPDGNWGAFASSGSGGARVRLSVTECATKRDARVALAKLESQLARRAVLEPHRLTLAAYLQKWLTHLDALPMSAHGRACYRSIVKRHVTSQVGRTRLEKLRPLPLQEMLDAELEHYAPGTVRKHYAMLHAALAQAVKWRLLTENPMDDVKKPVAAPPEMHALDEAAAEALVASLAGTRYQMPVLVAVTTGLRRGELLALRWRDLDLENGTLTVARAVDEAAGVLSFKAPKSKASARSFGMLAATTMALKEHKRQQAADRLADAAWHDHGLVFPALHGDIWRPSTFSAQWQRLDSGVRFHDLRHTAATAMLRAGVPVDVAAKRLGHTPTMLLTTYAHVLEDADSSAVARLEAAFAGRFGI